MSKWCWLPSLGASGGILVGVNEDKFVILNTFIGVFTVTVHLKTKMDDFEWLCTFVYGPVLARKRRDFLKELSDYTSVGVNAWVLCGDFNMVRRRDERIGPSYNHIISNRFNKIISDLNLLEFSLQDRQFTWARSPTSRSLALLDRCFCTIEWERHYCQTHFSSFPRVFSDHSPLLLKVEQRQSVKIFNFKFDKSWITKEGFMDLLERWWSEKIILNDIGNNWRLKLQYMRQKLRGWNCNLIGEQKRKKQQLLADLAYFEFQNESAPLDSSDYTYWLQCKSDLHNIFLEEEAYWQQRARLQWFLEGDINTKFFHVSASTRRRKNTILSLEIDGIQAMLP